MTTKEQSNEFPKRMMLVIHSMRGGGSERQMSYLANEIAQRAETCLITLDDTDNDGYPLDSRIERIGLKLATSKGGFIHGLWNNIRRIRSLRRQIRIWNPEVVLSFCDSTNILVLIACPSSIPVVISERSDPRRQRLGAPWEFLRRRFYPRARSCIAQTREVGNYLASNRLIDPLKIIVIPSAIRIPEFELSVLSSNRLSQSRKTLLFLGRLSIEKRVDRLLGAWAKLTAYHETWQLRIVGDGLERGPLQKLALELGIQKSVQWALWSDDVWASLASAHAYCLVSEYEGFPQSMLEAMASGLPVAVLDCSPAVRTTLHDGETGLIIPSETDIPAVLNRLLASETLRKKLGENAAIRARDFAWSVLAPQWLKAIATARI